MAEVDIVGPRRGMLPAVLIGAALLAQTSEPKGVEPLRIRIQSGTLVDGLRAHHHQVARGNHMAGLQSEAVWIGDDAGDVDQRGWAQPLRLPHEAVQLDQAREGGLVDALGADVGAQDLVELLAQLIHGGGVRGQVEHDIGQRIGQVVDRGKGGQQLIARELLRRGRFALRLVPRLEPVDHIAAGDLLLGGRQLLRFLIGEQLGDLAPDERLVLLEGLDLAQERGHQWPDPVRVEAQHHPRARDVLRVIDVGLDPVGLSAEGQADKGAAGQDRGDLGHDRPGLHAGPRVGRDLQHGRHGVVDLGGKRGQHGRSVADQEVSHGIVELIGLGAHVRVFAEELVVMVLLDGELVLGQGLDGVDLRDRKHH